MTRVSRVGSASDSWIKVCWRSSAATVHSSARRLAGCSAPAEDPQNGEVALAADGDQAAAGPGDDAPPVEPSHGRAQVRVERAGDGELLIAAGRGRPRRPRDGQEPGEPQEVRWPVDLGAGIEARPARRGPGSARAARIRSRRRPGSGAPGAPRRSPPRPRRRAATRTGRTRAPALRPAWRPSRSTAAASSPPAAIRIGFGGRGCRAAGPNARDRKRQERRDAQREPGLVAHRVRREHAEQRADHEHVGGDPMAAPPCEADGPERAGEEHDERQLERRERRGLPLGDGLERRVAEHPGVVGGHRPAVGRHQQRAGGDERQADIPGGKAPGAPAGARRPPAGPGRRRRPRCRAAPSRARLTRRRAPGARATSAAPRGARTLRGGSRPG